MTEELPEPMPLEDFFQKHRDAGKKDEEIVKMVFEADLDADVSEIERITGLPNLTIGRTKGQVSMKRKREAKVKEKEKEKALEEGEIDQADARQLVAQFGREGLNKIKRGMLIKILKIAPGMTPKTAEWIMHKWDISPRVQDDPNDLYNMLHTEVGLRPNIAASIARDIFSLEAEYADILQQRGEFPVFIRPTSQQSLMQPVIDQYGYQQPQPSAGPFIVAVRPDQRVSQPAPPGYYTQQDMDRSRQEWNREEKLKTMEKELRDLRTDIPRIIKESMPQAQPSGDYEEVTEYIDREGRIVNPDNAASFRIIRRPAKSEKKGDVVDELIRLKQAGVIREGLDETTIRKIVKEESGSGKKDEKSPEMIAMENKLANTEKSFNDLKDRLETKEKEDLRTELKELRQTISNMPAGEWKTDEGKAIGISLNKIGSTLEKLAERDRLTTVKEILIPGAGPAPPSPGQMAPEEARGGVLKGLKEKGLVATIRERVGT